MRRHSVKFSGVVILAATVMTAVLALGGVTSASTRPYGTYHHDPTRMAKRPIPWPESNVGSISTRGESTSASITSCDPASGGQGQTLDLVISGTGTNFVDGQSNATFSGTGITVEDTMVLDAADADVTISIDPDARLGARDVNVITGLVTPSPLVGGFTVTYPSFYFAEGTCRPGFDPYICIQNPGGSAAQVTITYMKGDGSTLNQGLTVPAHSRATVNPRDKLGTGDDAAHDFSTVVQCTNGQTIIAERPMYFDYMGNTHLDWNGGHDVIGASSPSRAVGFAEGTCRPGFDTYFCIQNPNSSEAQVRIIYMLGNGQIVDQDLPVKAHSRATVRTKDKLGEGNDAAHDFSALVGTTNDTQIIVERPMYFNYTGGNNYNWTGGSDVVGTAFTYETSFFAEGTCRPGFDPYICIQNPGGSAAQVTITYMKGDGSTLNQGLTVPAHSRATVNPRDKLGTGDDAAHDFSTVVECANNQMIIVERPMYFDYMGNTHLDWNGGHDVIGSGGMATGFGFAEGTCRPGFDTYFCIQNPENSAADVTITYIAGDGSTPTQELVVPAHSRATVRAKDKLGEGNDAAHDFSTVVECTNNQMIIVERPMYFNYSGGYNHNWTGGSDVVGYY